MIQMTEGISSETTLCKRHYVRYEGELRMNLKMLTIKSEELDTYMYSRNTRLCIAMAMKVATEVQRIRQIFQTDGELKRLHEEIAAKLGFERRNFILFLVYMYLYLIAFQKDFVVNYKNTYIPIGQDNYFR